MHFQVCVLQCHEPVNGR